MKAKLTYIDGTDRTNLLADIVAILAGETDKANLSANCNQANTDISTAIAVSGWVLHDAAASADSQVLRAPHFDNASSFKYVQIHLPSGLNLEMQGYEDWDNTAHTGTNQTGNNLTSYEQRVQANGAGIVYIWATARFIAIFGEDATLDGDEGYRGPTILAEHSRLPPWNTSTNNMPSFALIHAGFCFGSGLGVWLIRALSNSGAEKTGTAATAYMTTIGASYNNWQSLTHFPSGPNNNIPDGLGANFTPFFPLYLQKPDTYGVPLGDISSICDIWAAPKSLLGHLEIVTQNSVDYIACQGNNNGMSVLFPSG
jgi:hypothetical protein